MHKRKGFFVGEKKGISVMVGYVLLIVFVIIIGGIVYQWLKTYIPAQALECPDGVSLFIKEAEFNDSNSRLMITLRNNGRFNLAGYFIHATNSSDQELPIIDLSGYLNYTDGPGRIYGNSVLFFDVELVSDDLNLFAPGSEKSYFFDIPPEIGEPHLIRITPTRFQDVDERERFVSCSNAGAEQIVGEPPSPCDPDCAGRVCGSDGCGGVCLPNTCGDDFFCDAAGLCISTACTPAADPTLSGICGSDVCETATNGTCGEVSCGTCNTEINEICVSGQCTTIGNGVCDPGETCANEPACEGQQASCQVGEICQGVFCEFNAGGEFNSCGDYCYLFGYAQIYACQDNPLKCEPPQGPVGGIYIGDVEGANETYGNSFCLGDPYCCCIPT